MRFARMSCLGLVVIAAVGCAGGNGETAASADSQPSSTAKQGSAENTKGLQEASASVKRTSPNFGAQPSARSVIRNGSLTVRVGDVEAAERKITNWVTLQGGFVATSDSSNLSEASPTLTMSLRVPVSRFDQAFSTIESMGTRLAKKISAEDVTSKVVDLDARLGIMRAQEQSFRNALARMSDQSAAYDMQTRLMDLRGQIESLTSQRKTLGDLASLSTLDVTLQGSAKGLAQTDDTGWAQESWNTATSALGSVMRVLGSGLIMVGVFSPLWLPGVFYFSVKRRARVAQ